jgi:hypothetical protein
MFMYCVRKLRRSEPAAYHRIRAARAARRFPVIFDCVAEARLSLSAVVLLAPYLIEDTAQELIAAATHKTLAEVQRAVWQRDGDQCTFVSEDGHRCEERRFVELDHIEAVARGGEATVANLRVLCRAHNQLEAERTFGAEFMRHKRTAAAEARVAAGP